MTAARGLREPPCFNDRLINSFSRESRWTNWPAKMSPPGSLPSGISPNRDRSQSYKAAQPPVFAAATAIDAIHTPVLYLRQIGNLVFTPPFSMDRSAR
jgi:hypothetical protein